MNNEISINELKEIAIDNKKITQKNKLEKKYYLGWLRNRRML